MRSQEGWKIFYPCSLHVYGHDYLILNHLIRRFLNSELAISNYLYSCSFRRSYLLSVVDTRCGPVEVKLRLIIFHYGFSFIKCGLNFDPWEWIHPFDIVNLKPDPWSAFSASRRRSWRRKSPLTAWWLLLLASIATDGVFYETLVHVRDEVLVLYNEDHHAFTVLPGESSL